MCPKPRYVGAPIDSTLYLTFIIIAGYFRLSAGFEPANLGPNGKKAYSCGRAKKFTTEKISRHEATEKLRISRNKAAQIVIFRVVTCSHVVGY
jgi:hypothetical protein